MQLKNIMETYDDNLIKVKKKKRKYVWTVVHKYLWMKQNTFDLISKNSNCRDSRQVSVTTSYKFVVVN